MATPESKVKDRIKGIFKAHGVYWLMPMGTGYGKSGVPDFIACINGKFFGVEAKAGKGQTTALQDREMDFIRAAGGTALIINERNLHELENWIILQKIKENA